jgi:hypothetical protein
VEDNTPLNEIESLLVEGMQARNREIMRLYLEPFQADFQKVCRSIEGRIGLPVGSIGTTHVLDLENKIIMLTPPQEENQGEKTTEEEERAFQLPHPDSTVQ